VNNTLTRHSEFKRILKERGRKFNKTERIKFNPSKINFFNRIKAQEICNFTRQLATMIEAKLALTRSLEIIVVQINSNRFKNVVQDILVRVKGGDSLALSLRTYPKVFGELYISMIEVGEVAGVLDKTLNRLATHLEKMETLRRKIITAMSYPAIIIIVAIGAITFLLAAIVPTFAGMFRDFGAELPLLTRLIIQAGEVFKAYGLYFLFGALILTYWLKRYTKRGRGKYLKDKMQLYIPFWGHFVKKTYIARFCRTLATLLESGVSLLQALEVTAGISGNLVFEDSVHQMKNHATKGGFMAESLMNSSIFPPMVAQMFKVGEETAKLDIMSHKIADFYEDEVNAFIDTLTSIIEPVIIVFLGIILGGTVVAMYLQIFNLMDVIQ
jgi:type IV pilus assembly protein PilC